LILPLITDALLPAFRYQLRMAIAADSAPLLFADYFFIDTPSSPILRHCRR
jgi:hypothetical protein